jgi:ABC-type transporter Mla subunit MlaD
MDIHKFRELLESAQSDIESASYEMGNATSAAQGAESEADDAASTISKLISEVESLVGFDKDDLHTAIAHVETINRIQYMYTQRVLEILEGEERYADEARFRGLISIINSMTQHDGSALSWDQSRSFDTNYVGDRYEYTTKSVEKEA